MTGIEAVLSTQLGAVRRITLNKPEKRNAMDRAMETLLFDTIRDAMTDPETRVVVLAGTGPSFCSGADLKAPRNDGDSLGAGLGAGAEITNAPSDVVNNRRRVGDWLELWSAPKPVIAQVQGHCIGTANELVATADLVVCGPSAKFGMPEAREFALPPTLAFWPLRAGPALTKELLFTGRFVGAEEALARGLANHVVGTDDELAAYVDELAAHIAEVPAARLAMVKQAVNSWSETLGLREASYRGAEYHALFHQASNFADVVSRTAASTTNT